MSTLKPGFRTPQDRAAGLRLLVRDRAGQFTASFDAALAR